MSKEMGSRYAKSVKDVVYKNDLVNIENAQILRGSFRNFSGRKDSYNMSGKRMFSVSLEGMEDLKEELLKIGYVIKVSEPRPELLEKDPTRKPLEFITIGINCPGDHDDNPQWNSRWDSKIYIKTSGGVNPEPLNNRTIHMLDDAEIIEANIRIRPFTWKMPPEKDGKVKYGYKPMVDKMYITIKEDDFDKKYGM